jgi:ribosome-binding factor A
MSGLRSHARLREEIHREIAAIIEFECRDPSVREAFPTVMEVRLSSDARYAKVYVAAAATVDSAALLEALTLDRGVFRSLLAERLSLRHTPELRFVIDQTVEQSLHLDELLRDQDRELRSS